MNRMLLLSTGFLALAATSAFASDITSITMEDGSWTGGAFTSDGNLFDTIAANTSIWEVGVTAPGTGSSLMNSSTDGGLDSPVPVGTYWLYTAAVPFSSNAATEVVVNFNDGTSETAVFANGGFSTTSPVGWTQLSGDGSLSLAGLGYNLMNTSYDKVGYPDKQPWPNVPGNLPPGAPNDSYVLTVTGAVAGATPEPASIVLLGAGLGALGLLARRRRKA